MPPQSVAAFRFSHDSRLLALAGNRGIEIWRIDFRALVSRWSELPFYAMALEFSADDNELVAVRPDAGVARLSIASGVMISNLPGNFRFLSRAVFCCDSGTAAAANSRPRVSALASALVRRRGRGPRSSNSIARAYVIARAHSMRTGRVMRRPAS